MYDVCHFEKIHENGLDRNVFSVRIILNRQNYSGLPAFNLDSALREAEVGLQSFFPKDVSSPSVLIHSTVCRVQCRIYHQSVPKGK
jgi:hypothetical protein